jgi:hypothetical protein
MGRRSKSKKAQKEAAKGGRQPRKAPKLPPVRTGARPHSPAPPGRRGR